MSKKITLISFIIILLVSLTACGTKKVTDQNQNQDQKAYDIEKVVTLGNYKGLEVTVSPTEDQLKQQKESFLQSQTVTKAAISKVVKNGLTATIDFVGKMDGKKFDGGSAENFDLEIGSNSFIEGFEKGLVGKKIGQKAVLNLKFPENYRDATQYPEDAKKYNGKPVEFTVTIKELSEKVVPTYNDALVQKVSNNQYKTTAEYDNYLKEQLKESNRQAKSQDVFNQIMQNSKVNEHPEAALKTMKERVDNQYQAQAKSMGMSFENFLEQSKMTQEQYQQQLDSTAKEYLSQTLICEAIAKKENITVTQEDIEKEEQTFIQQYQAKSKEELETKFQEIFKASLTDIAKESALFTKVIDFVTQSAVEK